MARVIAITNQKGGVGKTTTAVNLAVCLSAAGQRVLLVDLDPQGNATMGCGVDKHGLAASTYEVLQGETGLAEALVDAWGLKLLGANGDLTGAEVALIGAEFAQRRLRLVLAGCRGHFDHVLVDCPPALNMLTINALTAADTILIPVQCEYYALEGLTALLDTVEKVRVSTNPGLRLDGLLRTMHDPRNRLCGEVSAQLIQHFGDRVYETVIPRNVRLAEAPSFGMPVVAYDRASRGAESYRQLAAELLRRGGRGRRAG